MPEEVGRGFRLWLVSRYTLHTYVQMCGCSYGQAKANLRGWNIGWENETGQLFLK